MPRAEAYGSSFVCLSVSHYAEGGATEAYCSRAVCLSLCRGGARRHTVIVLSVCHYAEGGATEAYCSRAVCQSVILSATHISSLAELSVFQSVSVFYENFLLKNTSAEISKTSI